MRIEEADEPDADFRDACGERKDHVLVDRLEELEGEEGEEVNKEERDEAEHGLERLIRGRLEGTDVRLLPAF